MLPNLIRAVLWIARNLSTARSLIEAIVELVKLIKNHDDVTAWLNKTGDAIWVFVLTGDMSQLKEILCELEAKCQKSKP